MIFGSFSITSDTLMVANRIRKAINTRALLFNPVNSTGFTGGYFLHNRLPCSPADLHYSDEGNDILILLSGYIYNKAELSELQDLTSALPDPEFIARLFITEGPSFVKHLNGDFAICIIRPKAKKAYLFRDHLGIRPLAYICNSDVLSFSSDITGLSKAYHEGQRIQSDYLMGYFKYIDYRKNPSKNVKKLLPGYYLEFSGSGMIIHKYWEPEKIRESRRLSHDRMLTDLRSLLADSVKIRCDSRFIAGAHVSGGIDSGIIAALARQEYSHQDDFDGYSWSPHYRAVPGDAKPDERELVIKTCEKVGMNAVFSDMNSADFRIRVSSFYDNHGFFSEAGTVDQILRTNTNLIFSGWGGDEFISTGTSAIEPDLLRRLKLRIFFRRNRIVPLKRFIKRMLYCIVFPALHILDRGTAESFRNDARYLKKPFRQSERSAIRDFHFNTSRRKFHLAMLRFYHLQERCESWFIMGYRNGIEYRYPLLDKRIIEYMLSVPSELLCKTDHFRPVIRELGEGILPSEVLRNYSKNDPVYWSFMEDLFREAAVSFMEETDIWRDNTDLHFVDFDLLANDISRYRGHPDSVDIKVLSRALVYLKAVHDFTVEYHGK